MLLYMQCTVVTKSSSNKCFFVSYQREQGEVEALKTIADMRVKPSALLRGSGPTGLPAPRHLLTLQNPSPSIPHWDPTGNDPPGKPGPTKDCFCVTTMVCEVTVMTAGITMTWM